MVVAPHAGHHLFLTLKVNSPARKPSINAATTAMKIICHHPESRPHLLCVRPSELSADGIATQKAAGTRSCCMLLEFTLSRRSELGKGRSGWTCAAQDSS